MRVGPYALQHVEPLLFRELWDTQETPGVSNQCQVIDHVFYTIDKVLPLGGQHCNAKDLTIKYTSFTRDIMVRQARQVMRFETRFTIHRGMEGNFVTNNASMRVKIKKMLLLGINHMFPS